MMCNIDTKELNKYESTHWLLTILEWCIHRSYQLNDGLVGSTLRPNFKKKKEAHLTYMIDSDGLLFYALENLHFVGLINGRNPSFCFISTNFFSN